MTETLLIVHILGAAAWIGGGFLTAFLGPRMARAGGETALNWTRAAVDASMKYYMPVGFITLLSGIGLLLVDDDHSWSDAFVSVGLAVVVITALMGSFYMRPAGEKAIEAAESGDFPTAAANGRKLALAGRVVSILLVLTLITMVVKL